MSKKKWDCLWTCIPSSKVTSQIIRTVVRAYVIMTLRKKKKHPADTKSGLMMRNHKRGADNSQQLARHRLAHHIDIRSTTISYVCMWCDARLWIYKTFFSYIIATTIERCFCFRISHNILYNGRCGRSSVLYMSSEPRFIRHHTCKLQIMYKLIYVYTCYLPIWIWI